MKLLALVTIFSSVCLITSFELSRVKRQGNEGLKDIKLYIDSGASCGGYIIFARICEEKSEIKCCEEKISDTFDSFSMISHTFNAACKSFGMESNPEKSYTISLNSFEDDNIRNIREELDSTNEKKEENFCPLKVELTTTRGNLFVTDTKIADGLVKSVPPQNLIYQSLQKPSTYFDEIHVDVGPGTSCGGHFIFAEICDADNKKCCMDQITPDPYKGFKAGSNLIGKFRNCSSTTMDVRTSGKDYVLKLSSFNEITRDSKESFCPIKAIIKTKGAGGEVRTKTIKFSNKVREHKVEGRFNFRLQPRPSSQYFKNINVKVETGVSCGGYYVFAKMCTKNGFTCCEEQIVPDPKSGFSGGAQISHFFSGDCKTFPIQINQDLTLSGWNDDSKKSEESFCPSTVKVTTNKNTNYEHIFSGSRQNSVMGELTLKQG